MHGQSPRRSPRPARAPRHRANAATHPPARRRRPVCALASRPLSSSSTISHPATLRRELSRPVSCDFFTAGCGFFTGGGEIELRQPISRVGHFLHDHFQPHPPGQFPRFEDRQKLIGADHRQLEFLPQPDVRPARKRAIVLGHDADEHLLPDGQFPLLHIERLVAGPIKMQLGSPFRRGPQRHAPARPGRLCIRTKAWPRRSRRSRLHPAAGEPAA